MHSILIQDIRLYGFELDHNATEATTNIYSMRNYGAVDHSIEKNCSWYFAPIERNSMIKLGQFGPKPVFQVKEANPVNSTWKVSGNLGISPSSVVCPHTTPVKTSRVANLCITLLISCKNFDSTKYTNRPWNKCFIKTKHLEKSWKTRLNRTKTATATILIPEKKKEILLR